MAVAVRGVTFGNNVGPKYSTGGFTDVKAPPCLYQCNTLRKAKSRKK